MIYAHVAYDLEANLGRAYNKFMGLLAPDDWAIFLDHDAMATTVSWYRQFAEAIAFLPDAGAFAAMTNRIARPWQRCGDPDSNDIQLHRWIGEDRLKVRTLLDITDTRGFGGVMFAVSKAAWQECGGFTEGGLGCTDHSLHHRLRAAGRRVWLHEGIYVYHFRHYGGRDPTSEHPKVPCPCMKMPDVAPTQRVTLP